MRFYTVLIKRKKKLFFSFNDIGGVPNGVLLNVTLFEILDMKSSVNTFFKPRC